MDIKNFCLYCNEKTKIIRGTEEFVECRTCGLIMRRSQFLNNELDTLYANSWGNPLEEISETGATDSDLAQQFLHKMESSHEIKSVKEKNILDFGAGRGSMLVALKNSGAKVTAVEPYGCEYLAAQGFSAYKSLAEIPEDILFDGIITIDVIEHLTKPWEDLVQIRSRLVPGGWLYITTPNASGLNAKLNGTEWREAKRKGHLWLFRPPSLEKMLINTGYSQVHRVHWDIVYNKNLIARIKDFLLLRFHLDGELRFIATAPVTT
jgi:SAM-dependent methyltransferase